MTPLEIRMLPTFSDLLTEMRSVTEDTPDEELCRVIDVWKSLRWETKEAAKEMGLPGGAEDYFTETVFPTPEWKRFDKIRTRSWQRKARAEAGPKAKAAEADRKRRSYYEKLGKPVPSTKSTRGRRPSEAA